MLELFFGSELIEDKVPDIFQYEKFRFDLTGPIELIEGKFKFALLQMHHGLEDMGLRVVFSILDGFGGIDLVFGVFGLDQVETRKGTS